jgi:hypothetical protein
MQCRRGGNGNGRQREAEEEGGVQRRERGKLIVCLHVVVVGSCLPAVGRQHAAVVVLSKCPKTRAVLVVMHVCIVREDEEGNTPAANILMHV